MSPLRKIVRPSTVASQQTRPSPMRHASFSRFRLAALGALLIAGLSGGSGWAASPGPVEESPLTAPDGVTALSGQVLTTQGKPLVNVALRDGGAGTRTDAQGRFLLAKLPAGVSVLTIDGRHAAADGKTDYGLFEVQVTAEAGQTTALPFTSYLPKIDHAHDVTIASPTTSEVVIKAATIPGLEVHIPAGAIITDTDGKPVTHIGITQIPLDRTPFPLPRNVEVPVFFTTQPGGGTITGVDGTWVGAQVYYPNYRHELPKARGSFWKYDPFQNGWTRYGMGRVSADGSQVVPDKDTRIYDLTGAMFDFGQTPPPPAGPPPCNPPPPPCDCNTPPPPVGCNSSAADPVDLASGLWTESRVDLGIADILPLNLTRTYQSGDFNGRSFGVGMNFSYDMFLYSAQQYQQVDLILPSGTPIHYTRIPNGNPPSNGYQDAVFVNTASGPSSFYQSHITYNGDGFDLTTQDGTVYVFGFLAPLQSIRDRYGDKFTITRTNGQSGNITQVTSPNGRFITFTRDSANRITQARDNGGRTVSYSYDSSGRMQTFTDGDGGVTTYGWDAGNHITTITDPRGNVIVTNLYDAAERVTTQTAADGGAYTFAYTGGGIDAFTTETDVTDPIGSVRKVTFNGAGYIATDNLAVGTPQEQDTSITRDRVSNLTLSTTDALNRTTAYTYDSLGNVASVTRLAGTADQVVSRYTYGAFKQLTSTTDALGHTRTIGLDALGMATSFTDAVGNLTQFAYNTRPYLSTITDPLGYRTSFTYDLGLVASVTDPLGRTSTVYTDPVGRALRSTDPLGNVATATYDPIYGVHQVTQPKGEVTVTNYLPAGLIGSVVDARSGATSYAYDAKRRLATRTDPLGGTDQITAYDGNDNVLTRIDRKGQAATYIYDPVGRMTTATYADGAVVSYTWDKGNRLTQIQDSSAGTITRTYDGLDHLLSETTSQGTVSYTYDTAGRRSTMTVPGQAQVNYSYDNANRLTGITQGSTTVTIGYDADGRRTTLALPNGIDATYSYDQASQLTGIVYSNSTSTIGTFTYGYDLGGRQISRGGTLFQSVLPAPLTSATYDAANRMTRRVNASGGITLTFDANGNLTSDGTHTYSWDARDRLITIDGGSGDAYDAVGRRVTASIGGQVITSLYDGNNPVQEQSGGAVLANLLTGLRIDERFMRTEGGVSSTYITDALGSVVAVTDGTGAIKTSYGYDPYGSSSVTGTANGNSYQYAGRQNDGTGLYYNRARYYNPAWGRFISEDPLGLAGGINRFAYAGGNPISFRDPTGLFQSSIGGSTGLGGQSNPSPGPQQCENPPNCDQVMELCTFNCTKMYDPDPWCIKKCVNEAKCPYVPK